MNIRLYASAFLVNERNDVLLVREAKEAMHGLWNFPGGHVEEGEEFADAAIRETFEETGLIVKALSLMRIFCGRDVGSLHFVFHANEYAGDIRLSDPHILDAAWMPLSALRTMQSGLHHPEKVHRIREVYEQGDWPRSDVLIYRR